jgi:hypothetical protein
MELEAARAVAERELFVGLDLTASGFDPGFVGTGVSMTTPDSPASRWLLFLSERWASARGYWEFETLDAVADDLRDGTLTPESRN